MLPVTSTSVVLVTVKVLVSPERNGRHEGVELDDLRYDNDNNNRKVASEMDE